MKYFSPLFPFIAGWTLLFFTDHLSSISLTNGILQLLLFAIVVCLPIWRTGRMSYVDIGWPWGLTVIGVLTWLYGEGDSVRVAIVSIAYILAGSRMGFGALKMWKLGMLKTELPRYEYQKRRWQKAGKKNTALAMQVEAISQGLANASFLAIPAFIIAANPNATISILEIVGIAVWLGAFLMESVADMQKLTFLRNMKKLGEKNKVCNVGLWKYSRHPNYFGDACVWWGIWIAAASAGWWVAAVTVIGPLFLTFTLTKWSGAPLLERGMKASRPGYDEYKARTSAFFPPPPR